MSNKPDTVRAWIEHLTAGEPLRARIGLRFPDCAIKVRTNSRPLLEFLALYFNNFIDDAAEPDLRIDAIEAPAADVDLPFMDQPIERGKTKVKNQYCDFRDGRAVRKKQTGLVFFFNDDRNIAWGPCAANANQVINFINARYIEQQLRSGWRLAHAAGVASGRQGLALAASSGRGKSTLALHLLSRGCDFVANDRLLFKRRNKTVFMRTVPKLPRVNPGTILNNPDLLQIMPEDERRQFQALPDEQLWKFEKKYDVFLDQCFGRHRFVTEAEIAGIVMLNWSVGDGPATLRSIDINDEIALLNHFVKAPGVFTNIATSDAIHPPNVAAYAQALKGVPIYELAGGIDFEYAVQQCLHLLNVTSSSEQSPSRVGH